MEFTWITPPTDLLKPLSQDPECSDSTRLSKKRKTNERNNNRDCAMENSCWQTTVNHAVQAIVSISFSQAVAFDTDNVEQGYILTNRHVACSGPFVGQAICHNHEEVDVHTIYRDPVHDFGFLKFDPKKIKYMPVQKIELCTDLAKVGLDARVVGKKLDILAGSVSRLDRNAPGYRELT
ncbi:hypothetical protein G6F56_010686 [Rhizopus delemar]|nr:hypothetical protein G6F56_010686 [Rhizopus delemar]